MFKNKETWLNKYFTHTNSIYSKHFLSLDVKLILTWQTVTGICVSDTLLFTFILRLIRNNTVDLFTMLYKSSTLK